VPLGTVKGRDPAVEQEIRELEELLPLLDELEQREKFGVPSGVEEQGRPRQIAGMPSYPEGYKKTPLYIRMPPAKGVSLTPEEKAAHRGGVPLLPGPEVEVTAPRLPPKKEYTAEEKRLIADPAQRRQREIMSRQAPSIPGSYTGPAAPLKGKFITTAGEPPVQTYGGHPRPVPLGDVPAMVAEMTGGATVRRALERIGRGEFIPSAEEISRWAEQPPRTLLEFEQPFAGFKEAIKLLPRAREQLGKGNIVPAALTVAESFIARIMGATPVGAAFQAVPRAVGAVAPEARSIEQTIMAPFETMLMNPKSLEEHETARLMDLVWMGLLFGGAHRAANKIMPKMEKQQMLTGPERGLVTRAIGHAIGIQQRRAIGKAQQAEMLEAMHRRQQAGLEEAAPETRPIDIQRGTVDTGVERTRRVSASPQAELAVRKLEDAFVAAQKSGTRFNIEKRFNAELARLVGANPELTDRVATIVEAARDYNRGFEKKAPGRPEMAPEPRQPEAPWVGEVREGVEGRRPQGPTGQVPPGEPLPGPEPVPPKPKAPPPKPAAKEPPAAPPTPPAERQARYREKIRDELFDLRDRINESRRFKGRKETIRKAQELAAGNQFDFQVDRGTGKAHIIDLETGKRLFRPAVKVTGAREKARLLTDFSPEEQERIRAVADVVGKDLDVSGLSKEQVEGGIKDILAGDGKEQSERAQSIIDEILGGPAVGVRLGQRGGRWVLDEVKIDDVLRLYEEEVERRSIEPRVKVPEEEPAFARASGGGGARRRTKPAEGPKLFPEEEIPEKEAETRIPTSEELQRQRQVEYADMVEGLKAELPRLKERREQLRRELQAVQEAGKKNYTATQELEKVNRRIGKINEVVSKTQTEAGTIFDRQQDISFGVGLGQMVERVFYEHRARPQIAPERQITPEEQTKLDSYMKMVSIGEEKKTRKTFQEVLLKAYQLWVHGEAPIKRLEDLYGTKLPIGRRPYANIQRVRGLEDITTGPIEGDGTYRYTETGESVLTGPSLRAILEPISKHFEDLRELLVAERDIELMRQGKGFSGKREVPPQEAIDLLKKKWGDNYEKLERKAAEVREWEDLAIFQPLRDIGRVSGSMYRLSKMMHKFHVPWNRVFDEPEPVEAAAPTTRQHGATFVKRMKKASPYRVKDPVEEMINRAITTTELVEHQRVVQSLYGMKGLSPDLETIFEDVLPKPVPVAQIKVEAVRDAGLRRQLLAYAERLAIPVETSLRLSGVGARNALGAYFPAEKMIRLRHIAGEHELAHEIGHGLDYALKLQDKFIKFRDEQIALAFREKPKKGKYAHQATKKELRQLRKAINDELRTIADLRQVDMRYAHKGTEKIAEMIGALVHSPHLFRKHAPTTMRILERFMDQYEQLRPLKDISRSLELSVETMPEVIWRRSPFQPPGTLVRWVDGKRKFFKAPADVQAAIMHLRPPEAWLGWRFMNKFARLLRATATTAFEFMMSNPLRDQPMAMVYSQWPKGRPYGYIPYLDLAKGMFEIGTKGHYYMEFLRSGAAHSSFLAMDRVRNQARLARVLGRESIFEKAVPYTNPLRALQEVSIFFENATRVGAFKKARKSGAGMTEAMREAREITQDFSRMGTQGRLINMVVAFWNANVGGWDKIFRAFKDQPGITSFRIFSGIVLPSILTHEAYKDDPEYKEFQQWEKDLFWFIKVPLPGGDHFWFRYPKPFELGIVFGSGTEHILDWVQGRDTGDMEEFAEQLWGPIIPAPTVAVPAVEALAGPGGYSWFRKRPIVPGPKQELPAKYQSTYYTSEAAKLIGEKFNLSPAKIDHVIRGYTAGIGRMATDLIDEVYERTGLSKRPVRPSKGVQSVPGIRRFTGREPIGSRSESVKRFYDLWAKARSARAAVKDFLTRGEDIEQLLKEMPEYYLWESLEDMGRSFAEINKAKADIWNNRYMSAEEKQDAIRELDMGMTLMAQEIVGESRSQIRQTEQTQ
jgi:hypothetical protein